jgi:hypothetical protein
MRKEQEEMPTNVSPSDIELRSAVRRWAGFPFVVSSVCLAALLSWPAAVHWFGERPSDMSAEMSVSPACAEWDELGRRALIHLVRRTADADLRKIGDAVFRMRRARRNCNAGWLRLACLDYRSVVRDGGDGVSDAAFVCIGPQAEGTGTVFDPPAAWRTQ